VGADSVGFNHHSIRTITISCHHAFDYIISNPSATSSDFFFLYIQPEQWHPHGVDHFSSKMGYNKKEKVHKLGVEFLIADGRPQ
jgi:hypothetical protein